MMIAFGIACMIVYAVNAWAFSDARPRYADAAGVSALLCVSYGMTNGLVTLYGLPEAILYFPVVDAVMSFMLWRAWSRNKRRWKLMVLGLLVMQLFAHVVFIREWNSGGVNGASLWNYLAFINLTFAAQLVAVGSAGIGHAVARACAALPRFRGHRFVEGGQ